MIINVILAHNSIGKRVRKNGNLKTWAVQTTNHYRTHSLAESHSRYEQKINRFVFETISYWQKGLVITLYHRKFITVHLIFHYGFECYGFLII